MVYFKDSQAWIQQSTLLLEARPTTTRISTRYTLLPPTHRSLQRTPKPHVTTQTTGSPPFTNPPTEHPPPSRAYIVLKTFDPVSGTCLKYRTDKAAEVGRLVAGLGRCARVMAALPLRADEEGKDDRAEERKEQGRMDGLISTGTGPGPGVKEAGGAGTKDAGKAGGGKVSGGGGKKKKGKR